MIPSWRSALFMPVMDFFIVDKRRRWVQRARQIFMLALAFVCWSGTTPAEDVSNQPAKQQEGTLFPVPDYGGDLWHRSRLTGDWGGLRTKLANHGVQLEMDITHYFQDVAAGGVNTTGRYIGAAEIVLKLDSQKMGLWPGGFLFVRGEAAFQHDVNKATGAIMPVNTEPILEAPNRDDMILPHVVLTQFLSEKFGVALGKLDTTVGDPNEFAHGRGDDKFMNLSFNLNPVALRTTPYSALGMALVYLPTKDLMLN